MGMGEVTCCVTDTPLRICTLHWLQRMDGLPMFHGIFDNFIYLYWIPDNDVLNNDILNAILKLYFILTIKCIKIVFTINGPISLLYSCKLSLFITKTTILS